MARRVTLRDLAKRLNLHITTVSKALRNARGISAKTKRKVNEAAAHLGYVPDPMLQSLAIYRTTNRPRAFQAVLAWLSNYPRGVRMDRFAGFADYYRGARERALALGYQLDEFHVEAGQKSLDRLAKIFATRNINGIIVAPQVAQGVSMVFPWGKFSAVTIGLTLASPRLNVVTNDHFHTILSLHEELFKRGYRRIGCYLRSYDNERIEGRFRSALLALMPGHRQNILTYETSDRKTFLQWFRRGGFDGIITGERNVVDWLRSAKIKIPDSIGVVHYALDVDEPELAGMYHNNKKIGSAALNWLVGMIQRDECGPPETPARLMIESRWIEGHTLRPSDSAK